MPDSYRDIADSVGLLGYWSANDLYEESDYVRCTCTDAAGAINEMRERLSAFEDAENQGRLVILPCKVGDTIYVIHDGKVWDGKVYHISYSDYYGEIIATAWVKQGISAAFKHFGKTVFLTREEAEAALKGGHDDGTA